MVALTEEWATETAAHRRVIRRLPSRGWWVVIAGDLGAAIAMTALLSAELAAVRPEVLVSLPLLWLACLGTFRGYERRLMRPWTEELHRVFEAGLALALIAAALAAAWGVDLMPVHLLALFGITVGGSLMPRAAVRVWRLRARTGATGRRHRVIVAGPRPQADRLVEELHRSPGLGLDITVAELPDLREAIARDQAEAVIALPCPELDPPTLRRLGWELERTSTQLFVASGLVDVLPARAAVSSPGSVPMVHVRAPQLSGVRRVAKDACERSAALLALLLFAPVLALVAIIIRLDSPGSVLFCQQRVGRNGRTFTMLKFRTMYDGAEKAGEDLVTMNETDGVLFKIRQDPRVTRLGHFLRRYSIDEVPQLINVVSGRMALVGPRPPIPAEVLLYESDTHRRFAVKPGVTGLWQVSGRSDLSWDETVRLDLHYVDNWSLGLDLRIVVRTVRAVVRHTGAY